MTTQVGGSTPKAKRAQHPNSLANLRPAWKKGESGNPAGMPVPGPKITPALRRFADLKVKDFYRLPVYDELTMAEAIAAGILMLAIQGEGGRERGMALDRLDGPLPKPTVIEDNRTQVLILAYDVGDKPEEIG